jgi:hypothetical protein
MNWPVYALFGFLVGLALGAPFIYWRYWQLQLSRAGLESFSQMTDEAMYLHMVKLFGALGYRVFQPKEQEKGFDLLLVDGLGQRRGVLFRDWNKVIDEDMVRSVASMTSGGASAMIVTVEHYTAKARKAAEETGTITWSLRDLTEAIGRVKQHAMVGAELPIIRTDLTTSEFMTAPHSPDEAQQSESLATLEERARQLKSGKRSHRPSTDDGTPPKCPRCGKRMVTRKSRSSEYWGCATYPRCLGAAPKKH